jgi:phosphohistidine phosphatase SixA
VSKRQSTCVIVRHGDDRRASQAPTDNEVDVSRSLEQDGIVECDGGRRLTLQGDAVPVASCSPSDVYASTSTRAAAETPVAATSAVRTLNI